MSIYSFTVKDHQGKLISLDQYKGKVLLIVNTASKCGFTPQYAELEELHKKYHDKGLAVLAFPCDQFAKQEFAEDDQIQSFCQLNYGVTFPVYARINVNGPQADPLYQYLCSAKPGAFGKSIKWNFTKFLIDREGRVVRRFSPMTKPSKIQTDIEKYLKLT